jgi:predicted nuclease with TOPRIM domain
LKRKCGKLEDEQDALKKCESDEVRLAKIKQFDKKIQDFEKQMAKLESKKERAEESYQKQLAKIDLSESTAKMEIKDLD